MEEQEPTIMYVMPDPEERKIVVVYRMNIPDDLVAPTIEVTPEEGEDPQEWIITRRERVMDKMDIPDGYYVTYEPSGEEEEEEEGGLN